MKLISLSLLGLVAGLAGCSFMARSPDQYRDDTAAVLDTRAPQVKTCYDNALKGNPALSGQVTVKFTVEKDTGNLSNITTDAGGTTAPPELASCVSSSLAGLVLTPPDAREGAATFVYDFTVSAPPPAPAPAG
jgi:hypothetical protein